VSVLDESPVRKSGTKTVGAARQWNGRIGQVDLRQVGTVLAYANGPVWTWVDGELFRPEHRFGPEPAGGRKRLGVPTARTFRTEVELGGLLLRRARAEGLPFEAVGCDERSGRRGGPRARLDAARIVYVDVDDFRKHRPAAAALYGDVRAALAALAEAARDLAVRGPWQARVAEASARTQAADAELAAPGGSPVHPARLVAEVERYCDPDAIVVGDGGDFVSFAGRLVHRRRPGLWIDGGPYGCLGSGPGYALAAKLAYPDRQVVLLSGDGAFGFSAMEFDTLVRHRLPVVCVIGNNGIWALEKHPMQNLLGTSIASDLAPRTRYDQVVAALGGFGQMVDRPEEIRPALERAFKAGVPSCINVICDPAAEYPRSSVLI